MNRPARALAFAAGLLAVHAAPVAYAEPSRVDPAARRARVEKAAGEVLADPRYRYCHDPEYPLYADEAGWCPHVGDPNARCPSLPRACTGDAFSEQEHHAHAGGGKREPEDEPWWFSLPRLGVLGQVLLWLVLGGALIAVLYAVGAGLGKGRDPAPEELAPVDASPGPEGAPVLRGPIETDVERLLALARAAAERGDWARALDFLYAALLRRLEGDNLIRVRPFCTNGDYLRDLRARADLYPGVKAIVREIERVQFGAAQPSAGLYGSLYARVQPFVQRSLALFALFAFVGGLSACSRHPRGAADDSPSGTHAVFELLAKAGLDARTRLRPLDKIGPEIDVLVLLPGAPVDAPAWERLLAWVRGGHTLVVATGSSHLPAALGVDVHTTGAPAKEPARVVPELQDQLGDLTVKVPEGHHLTVKERVAQPLLVRGTFPYAAWTDLGDGVVVTFADDHLFTNAAVASADDAVFLVAVLEEYGRHIEVADASTGAASPNPVAAVAKGKLLPLTLQLAFLLVLFFVYRGAAFGTLKDPPAQTRRSFADHARALGQKYERAHATRHVLGLYSAWALDRMRAVAQPGGKSGLSNLAEAIARRTGRPMGDVMRILVEAKGALDPADLRRTTPGQASAEDVALLTELHQLMDQIGGTRERRRAER